MVFRTFESLHYSLMDPKFWKNRFGRDIETIFTSITTATTSRPYLELVLNGPLRPRFRE